MREVENRIRTEKRIAKAFLKSVFDRGYVVEIDNGEESVVAKTLAKASKAMFATDRDHVWVLDADEKAVGWALFVYGNEGWDVISDYTINLDSLGLMAAADALALKLAV